MPLLLVLTTVDCLLFFIVMSTIHVKRSFSQFSSPFEGETHCSPMRPQLDGASLSSHHGLSHLVPLSNKKNRVNGHFAPVTEAEDAMIQEVYFDRAAPSTSSGTAVHALTTGSGQMKQKSVQMSTDEALLLSAISTNCRKKKLDMTSLTKETFSYAELKAIVSTVLSEQKESLSAEYDGILNEKLKDQFEIFTKFNHDYLHGRTKKADLSYLS